MLDREFIENYIKNNKCSFYSGNSYSYFIHQISARYWRIEDSEGEFLMNMKANSMDIVYDVLNRFDFDNKKTIRK